METYYQKTLKSARISGFLQIYPVIQVGALCHIDGPTDRLHGLYTMRDNPCNDQQSLWVNCLHEAGNWFVRPSCSGGWFTRDVGGVFIP
jgi:hypothetical protein